MFCSKSILLFVFCFAMTLDLALSATTERNTIKKNPPQHFLVTLQAGQAIRPDVRTHIVVGGQGNDLSYLPQVAAATHALRLQSQFPQEQVIFISPDEHHYDRPGENKRLLMQMGMTRNEAAIQVRQGYLTGTSFIQIVSQFTKIVSLSFHGHNAVPRGFFLDRNWNLAGDANEVRLLPQDPLAKLLVGHFESDATVHFFACNAGWVQASYFSRVWGIPVFGALTGTHFEGLLPSGDFVTLNPSLAMTRARSVWTQTGGDGDSTFGFFRMRPDGGNYGGHYGKYSAGFPHYKLFCGNLEERLCYQIAVKSLWRLPLTLKELSLLETRAGFRKFMIDWMCPGDEQNFQHKQCVQKLAQVTEYLKPMQPKPGVIVPAGAMQFLPFYGQAAACPSGVCMFPPQPERNSEAFIKELLGYLTVGEALY